MQSHAWVTTLVEWLIDGLVNPTGPRTALIMHRTSLQEGGLSADQASHVCKMYSEQQAQIRSALARVGFKFPEVRSQPRRHVVPATHTWDERGGAAMRMFRGRLGRGVTVHAKNQDVCPLARVHHLTAP